MIKRLDLSNSVTHPRVVRPDEVPEPRDSSLFSHRRPLRKVLVLVDAELLADGEPQSMATQHTGAQALLRGQLEHPLVRVYRYADAGPPSTVNPLFGGRGVAVYEGWAVLRNRESYDGVWSVTYPTDGGYSLSGVIGNAPEVAAKDTKSGAYRELAPSAAQERRKADALAAEVASQALHADIFVTERPYLHARTGSVARGVTVCRVDEAVALLGLYLRAQGEFLVPPLRFNRGLFFWVGTREILPSAWRWFSACVKHATGSGDDGLMLLGGSLLQRVSRALEARDTIHITLNQKQDNDVMDAALASLDLALVLLMGAVDATARVAHRVLGLAAVREYRAAWQDTKKHGWLAQVRAMTPALAAVVDIGKPHQQALTILRLLRNSVHGVALQGTAMMRSGAPPESLVGLPTADEPKLLAAMGALGGEASWGVRRSAPGRSLIDPGILVDRLVEAIATLLNDLMAQTPVEQLAHVTLSAGDAQPPSQSADRNDMDLWAPWIMQGIRLQLGL